MERLTSRQQRNIRDKNIIKNFKEHKPIWKLSIMFNLHERSISDIISKHLKQTPVVNDYNEPAERSYLKNPIKTLVMENLRVYPYLSIRGQVNLLLEQMDKPNLTIY